MRIVDTHAHIYSEDETTFPKIAEPLRPPKNTGTQEHLRAEVAANGVHRVVLIQTLTAYQYDNRVTCAVANENREWTTGVCTLNPVDPQTPATLERLAQGNNIRGTRVYPTSGPQPTLRREGYFRLWQTAERLGIVVQILVDHPLADELSFYLESFPDTPVVLDHCMNYRAGDETTLQTVCDMARHPNLIAKLSFAVTGSNEPYPCPDTHDAIRKIIAAYSPERCIWGSDFPCELWCPKTTYATHLRIFTDELGLDDATQRAVLGETAMRVWFPSET